MRDPIVSHIHYGKSTTTPLGLYTMHADSHRSTSHFQLEVLLMQTMQTATLRAPVAVAALLLAALNVQAQPREGQGREPKAEELTCAQLRREALKRPLTENERVSLTICRALSDIPSTDGHSTHIKPPIR